MPSWVLENDRPGLFFWVTLLYSTVQKGHKTKVEKANGDYNFFQCVSKSDSNDRSHETMWKEETILLMEPYKTQFIIYISQIYQISQKDSALIK